MIEIAENTARYRNKHFLTATFKHPTTGAVVTLDGGDITDVTAAAWESVKEDARAAILSWRRVGPPLTHCLRHRYRLAETLDHLRHNVSMTRHRHAHLVKPPAAWIFPPRYTTATQAPGICLAIDGRRDLDRPLASATGNGWTAVTFDHGRIAFIPDGPARFRRAKIFTLDR